MSASEWDAAEAAVAASTGARRAAGTGAARSASRGGGPGSVPWSAVVADGGARSAPVTRRPGTAGRSPSPTRNAAAGRGGAPARYPTPARNAASAARPTAGRRPVGDGAIAAGRTAHPVAQAQDGFVLQADGGTLHPATGPRASGWDAPPGWNTPAGWQPTASPAVPPVRDAEPRWDTTTPLRAPGAVSSPGSASTMRLAATPGMAAAPGTAAPGRAPAPEMTAPIRGFSSPAPAGGWGGGSARDAARIASFGQAAVVMPGTASPQSRSVAPGEPDTLTGPLSVSTTARRAREAGAAFTGPPRQDTARSTGRPAVTSPLAAGPRSQPSRDRTGWDRTGWDEDAWDEAGPASGGHRRARGRRTGQGPAADDLPSRGLTRADRFADAAYSAGRMPASRGASSPARLAAEDADRAAGAHRAPMRRGNGRARLAAAGTVSLAGLSAIVAGVALGGDPGSTTQPLSTAAGDAPTIQYSGSTDAFGSSAQASRNRAQATPPRAQLAPTASQPDLTTTYVNPATAPIPVVTLVPRDEQPATGPTDLRGIVASAAGAASAAAASASSGTSATPTASASPTSQSSSLPFDPDSPATSQPASPSPSSGGSALPFHPVDVTPLTSTTSSATPTAAASSDSTASSASGH
jgi:hypothetical protein